MVLDVLKPLADKRVLERELEGYGIRLNKKPPNITFRKKERGGLNISTTVPMTNIEMDEIKAICGEYKIHNADVVFRCDATADDLIDVIEGNRIYIPCIYALNKIDQISIQVCIPFFFLPFLKEVEILKTGKNCLRNSMSCPRSRTAAPFLPITNGTSMS